MFALSARETAELSGATLVSGDPGTVCRDFVVDSRKVVPGGAFVAFPGERVDGNRFLMGALEAGAACLVCSAEPSPELVQAVDERGACLLRAAKDDAQGFLLTLAHGWRERHGWTVVGVTGSVGKTTTKELLAHCLATRYRVHRNVGNFNSVIGVPLTILAAPEDTEVFVCEMGMNHPGEIRDIAWAAEPAMGCITNIGTSHIGILGSREAIARAKGELIAALARPKDDDKDVEPVLALTAADDFTPFLQGEAEAAGVAVELVGTGDGCAVVARDVVLDAEGHPTFTVEARGETLKQTLKLTGRQVIPDYLLCCALCLNLGLSLSEVAEACATFEAPSMRQHLMVSERGFRVLDDSYNASPSSMAAALDVLTEMACEGRRIAVVGEVGELGDEGPRLHGLMGAYVAAKPLDMVVMVGGELADAMADGARIMGLSEDVLVRVPDAEAAARILGPVLAEGDLVLAKASRSVGLDRFVKEVLA